MPNAQTSLPAGFTVRFATEKDCPTLLHHIRQLAIYEKMEDQVVATEEDLLRSIFKEKHAEALIGEENGTPVAFTLFFHNYSTFLGSACLYLEDLYVEEHCRGKGYGKAMLQTLAGVAVSRGCQRFDWACLTWNTPSIQFYESLGATPLKEWLGFRLAGDTLRSFAEGAATPAP